MAMTWVEVDRDSGEDGDYDAVTEVAEVPGGGHLYRVILWPRRQTIAHPASVAVCFVPAAPDGYPRGNSA